MPIREFTDAAGVKWRGWSTVPAIPTAVEEELRAGWLTFDCESGRKRLAPIPDDWVRLRPEQLEFLCLVAKEMPRRTGPFPRMQRPDAADRRQG